MCVIVHLWHCVFVASCICTIVCYWVSVSLCIYVIVSLCVFVSLCICAIMYHWVLVSLCHCVFVSVIESFCRYESPATPQCVPHSSPPHSPHITSLTGITTRHHVDITLTGRFLAELINYLAEHLENELIWRVKHWLCLSVAYFPQRRPPSQWVSVRLCVLEQCGRRWTCSIN